jgi:protein-tyrosine phosphatase
MAEALLRDRLTARGVDDVRVHSAGLMRGGVAATEGARGVVAGLDGHVSRQLSVDLVAGADLVLGMAREHVREAVVMDRAAFPRSFTFKELVRRGTVEGPRGPHEAFDEWLQRIGGGRRAADLLGASADDDVADPIGGPPSAYRATAAELDALIDRFVELAWPRPNMSGA